MKITVETRETKVTIEEYFGTIQDFLDLCRRCAIGLTYHQESWNDAIVNIATQIEQKEPLDDAMEFNEQSDD